MLSPSRKHRLILVLVSLIIFGFLIAPSSSSSSSAQSAAVSYNNRDDRDDNEGQQQLLPTIYNNPFITASPLIVAAVCSDGIAMVTVHSSNENATTVMKRALSRRIHLIDDYGTYLLTAGFRADCDLFVSKSRSLSTLEIHRYGPPIGTDYCQRIARQLSFWMAQCAVSERLRTLSCVGLLSFTKYGRSVLCLVDPVGILNVRALAIGGGKVNNGNSTDLVADRVNHYLERVDFEALTVNDGVSKIKAFLLGNQSESLIPSNAQLETFPV